MWTQLPTLTNEGSDYDLEPHLAVLHDRFAGKIDSPEAAARLAICRFNTRRLPRCPTGPTLASYLQDCKCNFCDLSLQHEMHLWLHAEEVHRLRT
jgi:hypothetical protein